LLEKYALEEKMHVIKYGVKFYSNIYDYDILIFNNLEELRVFKNRIITMKNHQSNRNFIYEVIENLEKYNSMDIKRRRRYFIDDIIEQMILGNYIFDVINMGSYFIVITDEIIDPFINEFT